MSRELNPNRAGPDVNWTKEELTITRKMQADVAFAMRYWVLCPYQEPLRTIVGDYLQRVCRIAVVKFFKACPENSREDLAQDMFRAMWENLPTAYDPEKCPDEVNTKWMIQRAVWYAKGVWTRGLGHVGCKYTAVKVEESKRTREFWQELRHDWEINHPDAVSHKITNEKI